jgi:hypothetical protein
MKEQKWWHRLFNVLYFVSLAFIVFAAVIAAVVTIEGSYRNPMWLPNIHSGVIFASGLTGLISLLVLELIRKVAAYIVFDRKFLSFDFPKITLVLFAIFLLTAGVAGVTKYTYEVYLQNEWITERKEADTEKLTELKALLEIQREEAMSCIAEEQAEALAGDKKACEANYRRVKISYDSCMTYGWRTMCLQGADYEVIDCSDEALTKPVENFYGVCSEVGIRTMNQIETIEENLESNYETR